jgi:hypothetical protein
MIAYPFSSDLGVNDSEFIANGAAPTSKTVPGDKIYLWDVDVQGYKILVAQAGDGFWSQDSNLGVPVTDDFVLGDGFWYKAVTGGFSWVESNKYLGNL